MASKKTHLVAGVPGKDPTLPRVPITFNSNTYHLVYDFNAIATAEEKTGLNLFQTFDFSHLSVTKFRAMLYASLLKENPEMTLEEAGSFITIHNLADITVKIIQAWTGSMPEVKEEAKGKNEEAGDVSQE